MKQDFLRCLNSLRVISQFVLLQWEGFWFGNWQRFIWFWCCFIIGYVRDIMSRRYKLLPFTSPMTPKLFIWKSNKLVYFCFRQRTQSLWKTPNKLHPNADSYTEDGIQILKIKGESNPRRLSKYTKQPNHSKYPECNHLWWLTQDDIILELDPLQTTKTVS